MAPPLASAMLASVHSVVMSGPVPLAPGIGDRLQFEIDLVLSSLVRCCLGQSLPNCFLSLNSNHHHQRCYSAWPSSNALVDFC